MFKQLGTSPMGTSPTGTSPMGASPTGTSPMDKVSIDPVTMRRGGSVRNKPEAKFSSGGSVSKASSRGDGIAQRGKTKGRMC